MQVRAEAGLWLDKPVYCLPILSCLKSYSFSWKKQVILKSEVPKLSLMDY